MPGKTSGPLRIQSDGNGMDTVISFADGTALDGVSSMTIWFEPNELNRVSLDIVASVVDAHAYPDSVTLHCPMCGEEVEHPCRTDPSVTPRTVGGH